MATGRKRNEKTIKSIRKAAERKEQGGLRAVGYLRVSSEEQAESGSGLEYQRTAIEGFAKSQGYTLLEIVEDAGVSGSTKPEVRPGFGRILHDLAPEKGQATFDVLLVWKFDRLARSIMGAVNTADALKQRGVALRSVTEPIDTTGPSGETIFAVMAGMASMERENIARRTWEGRRKAAEKGKLPSGPAPYGYRRVAGKLEIVAAEAEVVRRIYALDRRGYGVRRIASTLNAEGIPTRSGKPWNPNTIAGILDQPLYRGTLDVLFGGSGMAQGWATVRVLTNADAPAILGKAAAAL